MNDRDRKNAGQDGIAVACRLQPELTRAELTEAAERYHFGKTAEAGEAGGLREVYERLQKAVDCRAVYGLDEERREAAAVITLGEHVDALQEEYQRQGLLTEAYQADCLCRELLRKGNRALDEVIRERAGLYAERYLFPGQNLPLEEMKGIFTRLEEGLRCIPAHGEGPDRRLPVHLLPGYVLLPRQSVAYVIRLSESARTECAGICAECERRESCESFAWPKA